MKRSLSTVVRIKPVNLATDSAPGSRKKGQLTATVALTGLLVLSLRPAAKAQVITFDNVALTDGIRTVQTIQLTTYEGLTWNNFFVQNNASELASAGLNGYANSAVSGDDIAYNGAGKPASITSPQPFTLDWLYLTSAWNDGLKVRIDAYNSSGAQIDETTEVVGVSGPTQFTFDWSDVSLLLFTSYGGTPHSFSANGIATGMGEEFALDNLDITDAAVPEPGACTLLAGLSLAGMALLRRRRFRR